MSTPVDPAADRAASEVTVLDAALLRQWPMPRRTDGDKFSRGTAVVVGGSPRTPGAVRLAGEAALRMGAGRLQIVTAADAAGALGVVVPEALVMPLATNDDGALLWRNDDRLEAIVAEADAVLIGPGLLGDSTIDVVIEVLRRVADDALVVLDAHALGVLADVPSDLVAHGRLVLTPNRQELERLDQRGTRGACAPDDDDAACADRVAQKYGAAVTCFGRVTTTEHHWDVVAGSPGLGTSGSGDVLAGLAVGAAARCGDIAQAACWATFAHAEAGASIARRAGELSFLARELVAEVPAVLGAIERSR
jgi:ADP-dependent NAD(P)H-hydrate dehydratase